MIDTRARLVNIAIYVVLGLTLIVAQWANTAIGSGEVDWFAAYPAAQYRGLALAILGYVIPLLVVAVAAYRTRIGSEPVAAQVNDLRDQGVSRQDMIVTDANTVATALSDQPFTPEQVNQLTTALLTKTGRAAA